jgi:predicted metal-dependent enzyme (double-stranded beta helix superfamily)
VHNPNDRPTLPAASKFVDEVRGLYAEGLDAETLWARVKDAMAPLLADQGLKESSKTWPLTVEDAPKVKNLLFYEDPDYGFVFNATVRKASSLTSIHDHGDVWTLYGIIEGNETMNRFERTDDGPRDEGPATLKQVGTGKIGPGNIDVVPPGKIHQERGGATDSMAFIVRAQKAGTFKQHSYNAETGEVKVNHGPALIPYALEPVT